MRHAILACLVAALPALALAAAAAGGPGEAGKPAPVVSEAAGAAPERAASPGTGDGEGCAVALVGRVQAHYESVRDLRASFEQTTRSVAFGGGAASLEKPIRGIVHFAKPGRMRWVYQEPEESLVVSDGETLWIHDPAAREVQVLPVGGGFLSGAAIQFMLGEGKLLDSFRVTARSCREPAALILTPRDPATYERLELEVDAASGAILQTVMIDLFGNRTQVRFSNVEINSLPPASLFRFEAPAGTRVLTLEPPA